MARNSWEKHAEAIAGAASGSGNVNTMQTSGLKGKYVVCKCCNGAGLMSPDQALDWSRVCGECSGRGFVLLAQPECINVSMGL